MASFETHLMVTTTVVGIATIPLLSSGMITTTEGVVVLFFGVIGGILPDIDSDNSIPIQIAFKILALILPLILVLNFADDMPLLHIAGAWFLASLLFYLVFTYIFLPLTKHRGIFHTIAMGIVLGELTTLFMIHSLNISDKISLFSGIYISFGFLIHLVLDEIYSVNLLGVSFKRSFGSALKIYDKGNIFGSVIINVLAVALFFVLPNIILNTLQELWELLSSMPIY